MPETTVTIKGKDELSAVIRGTTKSVQELTRELERSLKLSESQSKALQTRAKDSNRSYLELLRTIKANNEANAAHQKSTQSSTGALTQQATAVKGVSSSLVAMAAHFVSASGAAEVARRSFLAFAESDRRLKQLANTTELTDTAIKQLGKTIDQIAADTGNSTADMHKALKVLRDGMNLTLEQAVKLLPQVAVQARGMNASLVETAKLVSGMSRSFKIDDSTKAMEALSFAVRKLGLDAAELAPHADKIGDAMNAAGYSGIEGLTKTLALIAATKKEFGSTAEAADALAHTTKQLSSDEMGEALIGNARIWQKQIADAKKNGDALVMQLGKLAASRDKDRIIAKLDIETQKVVNRLLADNTGLIEGNMRATDKASRGREGLTAGFKQLTGAQTGIEKLTTSINNLTESFGELVDQLGVTGAIEKFAEKLNQLSKLFGEINSWIDFFSGKGDRPSLKMPEFFPHPMTWPSPGSVFRGMGGAAEQKAGQERLRKQIEPPGGHPAAQHGAPGWVPPAYKPLPASPMSYRGEGGGYAGMIHRASLGGGGGGGMPAGGMATGGPGIPVGASVPGARSALLGLMGQGPEGGEGRYGSSMDSRYLTAAYHPGGTVPPGGYGGGGGGGGTGAGPGGYGGGTGYGPRRGGTGPEETTTPPVPEESPAEKAAREPAPGAEGPVQPRKGAETDKPVPGGKGLYDPITGTLGGGLGDYRSGGGGHRHQGVDLLAPHGSQIYAAGGGTIIKHSPQGSFQKDAVTTVKLDDGRVVRYMHHKLNPDLKVGSRVEGGQPIGTSGTAAGVGHLHYEVWKGSTGRGGQLLDPIKEHGWKRGKGAAAVTPKGGRRSPSSPPETAAAPATPATAPATAAPATPATVAPPTRESGGVRGSWFGNAPGWRDPSEPVDSPKSSVPGIALPNAKTKGQLFVVTTPDGRQFVLPQTDYGPSKKTGRGIDVTAAAARRMGYKPGTFPTDKGLFQYRPYNPSKDAALPGAPVAAGTRPVTPAAGATAPEPIYDSAGNVVGWKGPAPERVGAGAPVKPAAAAPAPAASKPLPDDTAELSRPAETSAELTRNVSVNLRVNDNSVQFARSSMRRQADREVREARWNSFSDIGAA
jgi:Peptidase family M23